MKKIIQFIIIFISIFNMCPGLFAHLMWLTPGNYYPRAGEKVEINILWGHGFSHPEKFKEGNLNSIYAISPTGKKEHLKKISETSYSFTPAEKGYYLIAAEINAGFMTKTTTGRKMQSKKGLDNAVSCFKFFIKGKTLIKAGNATGGLMQNSGHALDIFPLKDIQTIKEGDVLPVRILFENKPASGVEINAVFSGFKTDGTNKWATSAKTDDNGNASIEILKKGTWLITVRYSTDYPDKEECDEYMHNETFTFEVK